MLEVQKFLKDISADYPTEYALDKLKEQYGIKYNIWDSQHGGTLVVLNYDQIDSAKHKFHPIVRECRSLVLELNTWEVVSRAFDRFYNYSEDPNCEYEVEDLIAYEKVDGSLISFFNYEGKWLYRTKSMIMPDTIINDNVDGVTWKGAIESAIDMDKVSKWNPSWTYLFELVCDYNRVVVKYDWDKPMLYLLNTRHNYSGEFIGGVGQYLLNFVNDHDLALPKKYRFDTLDHCLQSAKDLRNLEEGYVMLNNKDVPVMKVKNPAYVAAHHLRGNGPLTEKRVLDIILMNEQDEYLSIFPEDTKSFNPYIDAWKAIEYVFKTLGDEVELCKELTQKEFALKYKDKPYATIAFKVRQGKTVKESWDNLTDNAKRNMILAYKIEG